MTRKRRTRHSKHADPLKHALTVGIWAVLIALPVGFLSQTVIAGLPSLWISICVLLLVIVIGIVFDVLGVAVTAAREPPFHARAARGIFGAREASRMVQNAHEVASFCNDVVGDVSGTLSGAIGIAVVYQLFTELSPRQAIIGTTVMSAIIAGLIVGGKAYGKVFALQRSTDLVFFAARTLARARQLFSWPWMKQRSGSRRKEDA